MARSFSLAPGGWVGNTPGRSGNTWIEDLASDRKHRIDQEKNETKDLIQLLFQVDRQNTTLHPKQLKTPSAIAAPSQGPCPSNIEQEASTNINRPQCLKHLELITEEGVKDNTNQTGGYLPDIFDFMEGSSLAGMPDQLDHHHRPQTASPLAQYPRPGPRRVAPLYPVKPLSQLSYIAGNPNVHHRQAPYMLAPPTPPYSPYQFTHGENRHSFPTTQHSLVPYSSPSTEPQSNRASTSFTTPISATNSTFGSGYLQTSLIQAMDIDQSPNKCAMPAVNGIDPLVDQAEGKFKDRVPKAAPTASLSILDPFKPSRALLDLPRSVDPELAYMAERVGLDLSGNYKGDITKEHIYNAIAPVNDNCALHIIGLPADVTLREVFSVIVGKVFSFQLHSPVPGKWTGCGARLVFTNRAATEEFYWKARSGLGIIIRDHQIRVLWNRDPCRPQTYADRHQSRVLQIIGPNNPIFSAAVIEQFFSSKLLFKLVDRKEWLAENGVKVVELHFPSILGQSRPAMKQFYEMLDETEQRNIFKIHYAPDPCDPVIRGSTLIEHYQF